MQKWCPGFTRHPLFWVLPLCAGLAGCLGFQSLRGGGADLACMAPEDEALLLTASKAREAVARRQARLDLDGDGQSDAALWWLAFDEPIERNEQDEGEGSKERGRTRNSAGAPHPPLHHRSELFWADPHRARSAASLWEIEVSEAQLQRLGRSLQRTENARPSSEALAHSSSAVDDTQNSDGRSGSPASPSPSSSPSSISPKAPLHRAHYLREDWAGRRHIDLVSRHALAVAAREDRGAEWLVAYAERADELGGEGAALESSKAEAALLGRVEEGESEELAFREHRAEQVAELVVLDVPRDESQAIVRRRLEMSSSASSALLTESFDRDRDGFYGLSRQRIISRVRPWEQHGTVVLPEGMRGCSKAQREELERALDLALVHGAACVGQERRTPPVDVSESDASPEESGNSGEGAENLGLHDPFVALDSGGSGDSGDSGDSLNSPAPPTPSLLSQAPPLQTPSDRGDAAKTSRALEAIASNLTRSSSMQGLEWLWLHLRQAVEFACLSASICGAVDQLDVSLSWLDQSPVVLVLGVHAFNEKRCGPLPALLGRLIRYYDPAVLSFDEEPYQEFQHCIAERSRKAVDASKSEASCKSAESAPLADES